MFCLILSSVCSHPLLFLEFNAPEHTSANEKILNLKKNIFPYTMYSTVHVHVNYTYLVFLVLVHLKSYFQKAISICSDSCSNVAVMRQVKVCFEFESGEKLKDGLLV